VSDLDREIAVFPVQTKAPLFDGAKCPQVVVLKAYEVYCHVHRPQEAMITGGCRGGFSAAELIAFLYARTFPKSEWSARVDEALTGMEQL